MTAGMIPLILRPDLHAAAADRLRMLTSQGYEHVDEYTSYRAGRRLNARSHRYPGARERGVGSAIAVTVKENSYWAQTWSIPDVEIIILRWDATISQLGLHHVEPCVEPIAV